MVSVVCGKWHPAFSDKCLVNCVLQYAPYGYLVCLSFCCSLVFKCSFSALSLLHVSQGHSTWLVWCHVPFCMVDLYL